MDPNDKTTTNNDPQAPLDNNQTNTDTAQDQPLNPIADSDQPVITPTLDLPSTNPQEPTIPNPSEQELPPPPPVADTASDPIPPSDPTTAS